MIKGAIFSFIIFIIPFLVNNLNLWQKLTISIQLILLLTYTLLNYKRPFLEKIKSYKTGYIIQIILIILISGYFLLSDYLPEHNFYIVPIILGGLSIFVFILTFILPFNKYGRGVFIQYPKTIKIPISGRKFEVNIINKTPFSQKIKLKVSIPSNVKFKNKDSENIEKEFEIGSSKMVVFDLNLKAREHHIKKLMFLSLEDEYEKKDFKIIAIT